MRVNGVVKSPLSLSRAIITPLNIQIHSMISDMEENKELHGVATWAAEQEREATKEDEDVLKNRTRSVVQTECDPSDVSLASARINVEEEEEKGGGAAKAAVITEVEVQEQHVVVTKHDPAAPDNVDSQKQSFGSYGSIRSLHHCSRIKITTHTHARARTYTHLFFCFVFLSS